MNFDHEYLWSKYKKKLEDFWIDIESDAKYKGKLKGAITAGFIGDVIKNYFNENNIDFKVSPVNVFIKGYSTEFDILILKPNASEIEKGYPVYNDTEVKAIIEVKSTGIYFKKGENKNPLKRELEDYCKIRDNLKDSAIRFGYITMKEQIPKKNGSINFIDETRKFISEYISESDGREVYCLSHNKEKEEFQEYKNNVNSEYYNLELWINKLIN